MFIGDMFKKDIHREIQGVIKVAQDNDNVVYQELDEYVVTRELKKHLSLFYENYLKSVDGYTNEIGVWISGFFGSGKSHFLKILSYLLSNNKVLDKVPVEFFNDKFEDKMAFADMQRASGIECECILFNIDSKSPMGIKSDKDAILKVFVKVFYEHLGFYGDDFKVAQLEKFLNRETKLTAFKEEFKKLSGEAWEIRRNCFAFDEDIIVKALIETTGMSETSSRNWFNQSNKIDISIENFALEVKEYIESKGGKFHLVFLVDEIGQYIGENSNLMLNLQTITEDLSTHCKGRAWVIVTSQEDIDSVTKVKGGDFSKITGRFKTRLGLSSSSVDEVIKKRLLEKTRDASDKLKLIYNESCASLKNLIHFSDAVADLKGYSNEEEFIITYPFVPYQFRLLQNVFNEIRKHGASGKHLSEGERSMLSAFQESARKVADKPHNSLVPFYLFYDSIYTFLDGSIKRVIDRAQTSADIGDVLKIEDVDILKLLFLIRYVGDIPPTLENLATLSITNFDQDKLELKKEIKETLDRLASQNYIQKNADQYMFLTDDEQDISREIKNTDIELPLVVQKIAEYIFNDILSEISKYQYTKRYPFSFNKKIDEISIGNQGSSIGLRFLTSASDNFDVPDEVLKMSSATNQDVIIRLSESSEYFDEIMEAMRINKFIKQKNVSVAPASIKTIIDGKREEANTKIKNARKHIEEAITDGKVFVCGEKVDIRSSVVKEKVNNGFKILVESVYTKISYINYYLESDTELAQILKPGSVQIEMDGHEKEKNKLAQAELSEYIDMQDSRHFQITMKSILDRFEDVPYGWNEIDIAGLVARLVKAQKVRLSYQGAMLELTDKRIPDFLRKKTEIEKLIIKKRVIIDITLVKSAREICKEVFQRTDLKDDEDGLVRDVLSCIEERDLEVRQNYLEKYEGKKYPGRAIIEKGLKIFKELENLKKDNIGLLTKFKDYKNDLLDWDEDMRLVKNFFEVQKPIFDRGISVYAKVSVNKHYIVDEEMIQKSRQLEEIISNPIPYNHIKDIPDLAAFLDGEFNSLLSERKIKVKTDIATDKKYAIEMIDIFGVKEEDKQKFMNEIDKWYEIKNIQIEDSPNFERIDATISHSTDYKIAVIDKIGDLVKKYQVEPAIPGEVSKPVVLPHIVEYKEIAFVKSIETEEEVDDYTKKLGERLKQIIRENKKIRFKA